MTVGQRVISCAITNEYLSGDGVLIGAVGSHDDVLVELDFTAAGPMWEGTTRTVTFTDATGQNPVNILLTTNLLAEGQTEVYQVPVPGQAKAVAGWCGMTVAGEQEILRAVTERALFKVAPSEMKRWEGAEDVPASAAEQLQAEVDAVKEFVQYPTDERLSDYFAEHPEIKVVNGSVTRPKLAQDVTDELNGLAAEDVLLNARIDGIIAPTGEAPSAEEVLDARTGADGTSYASLGAAIRGQSNALRQSADWLRRSNIWAYGKISQNRAIAQSGSTTSNEAYDTTDYVPVAEGDVLYGYGSRYAFYDSVQTMLPGQTGVLNTQGTPISNGIHSVAAPAGSAYFRICADKTLVPDQFFVAFATSGDVKISDGNIWNEVGVYENRVLTQYGTTNTNSNYDTTGFIPVVPGSVIYGYGARFACYDASQVFVSDATAVLNNCTTMDNGMHYYVIPDGVAYFRICANKTAEIDQKQLFVADIFARYLRGLIRTPAVSGLKLYCLGDSITRGMFAEQGASSSSGPTAQSYPYWIGQINGYEIVNLGNSGSGWANVGTAESQDDPSTAKNAKDVVDDNTFDDADIITMAWGVNDWKGAAQDIRLGSMASASGDGTVVGNMKYCIETLMTKKPTAQLIVLLPLNTNRQWSGMRTMTLAENWAFGYAYRYDQTLEDYRAAIKECAEYYNVRVIDLEEVCPINRLNLRSVCGDGLHPTKAFHKQMGIALAPLVH